MIAGMSDYPLALNHCGVEYLAVLDNVCLATTLSLPAQTQIPVTLEADNRTGGWRIRSMFGTVGWLDADESAEYPALERVRDAGITVSTTAVVDLDDVAVNIGLAPWQIAVNNQPEGTVVLNGGVPAALDISMSDDVNAAQITALGTACVFVQLHHIAGAIVVTVDDSVLGVLGAVTDFGVLTQLLAQAPIAARAYIAGGMVAVDLPADPDNLFAPSVPPLPALADAPLLPQPTYSGNVDAELSFDPSDYLLPAKASKPASQRFITHQIFDDTPATEAFQALLRGEDPEAPEED